MEVIVDYQYASDLKTRLDMLMSGDEDAISKSIKSSTSVNSLYWTFKEYFKHIQPQHFSEYFDSDDFYSNLILDWVSKSTISLESMLYVGFSLRNYLENFIPYDYSVIYIQKTIEKFFLNLINHPENLNTTHIFEVLGFSNINVINRTNILVIDILRRFVLENMVSDNKLIINKNFFTELSAILPLFASRLANLQNIALLEAGIAVNEDSFLRTVNAVNRVKASNAAKAKAQKQYDINFELKQEVIKFYSNPSLAKKEKWKSRNEFALWFTLNHNKKCNEDQWIKDSTVKKWIKEYLEK